MMKNSTAVPHGAFWLHPKPHRPQKRSCYKFKRLFIFWVQFFDLCLAWGMKMMRKIKKIPRSPVMIVKGRFGRSFVLKKSLGDILFFIRILGVLL